MNDSVASDALVAQVQVVAFAADVARDLKTIGQPNTGNLPHGRVRLFRRCGVNARAHAPLLGAALERRDCAFCHVHRAWLPY